MRRSYRHYPRRVHNGNDSLLTLIERTLKEAKIGDKVVIYDERIRTESKRHIDLELSLKRCVGEGMTGFDVYYRPIVNTSDGAWRGLEALCRWNSPDLGQGIQTSTI